jgi:hypothetical protein
LRKSVWAEFKNLVLQNPQLRFSAPELNKVRDLVLQSPEISLEEAALEVGRSGASLRQLIEAELQRLRARGEAARELAGRLGAEPEELLPEDVVRLVEESPAEQQPPPLPLPPPGQRQRRVRLPLQVSRTLDKEYAELLSQVLEKTGWFNQVLTDLGFYSILLAFQAARVPPGKVPEQVERFRDPEEFTRFVKDQLSALMRAVQESERLLELEDELRELRAENDYLYALLDESLDAVNWYKAALATAMAVMAPQQLLQLLLAFSVQQRLPPQQEVVAG